MANEQKIVEKADFEDGFCLEDQLWFKACIEVLKEQPNSHSEAAR